MAEESKTEQQKEVLAHFKELQHLKEQLELIERSRSVIQQEIRERKKLINQYL